MRPLRIHITDPALRTDLVRSLDESDCSAVQLADGSVEVRHRQATNEREALLELLFFVRAWQIKHPHVAADVVG